MVAIKPLSKPPLGGLLSKKPLPVAASASKTITKAAAAELDALGAELEQKKKTMLDEQARQIKELETAYDRELEQLRKRLQEQSDELQEQEETKHRQKTRELEKKLRDLEDQFDRDENTLLRERREKLKRMECESETQLTQKRKDLDKEMEKLRIQSDTKLRDLRAELDKQHEEVKATLGEQASAAQIASVLHAEIDRLKTVQGQSEEKLTKLRTERDEIANRQISLEQKCAAAEQEQSKLAEQLTAAITSHSTPTDLKLYTGPCTECERLSAKIVEMTSEHEKAQESAAGSSRTAIAEMDGTITQLKKELAELRATATEQNEKIDQNEADKVLETSLRTEIQVLEVQLAAVNSDLLKAIERCKALEDEAAAVSTSVQTAPVASIVQSEELNRLKHQHTQLEEEAASLKSEVAELQDRVAVLSKTNVQIKEQLVKESHENKNLREQLDESADQLSQGLAKANEALGRELRELQSTYATETAAAVKLRREIQDVQASAATDRTALAELQVACDALRHEKHVLEQEKRSNDAELTRLDRELKQNEAERGQLSRQIAELTTSVVKQQEESEETNQALLTKQKWELEQLRATVTNLESDKQHTVALLTQREQELDELSTKHHQLELEHESDRSRQKKVEAEKNGLLQRIASLTEENDGLRQRIRVMLTEIADAKAQITKSKLREQALADKVTQAAEDYQQIEARIKQLQDEAVQWTKDNRSRMAQLEQKTVQCSELRAENELLQEQLDETKTKLADMKARQAANVGDSAVISGGMEVSLLRNQVAECELKIEGLTHERAQAVEKQRQTAQKLLEAESLARTTELERSRLAGDLQTSVLDMSRAKDRGDKKAQELEIMTASLRALENDHEALENTLTRERNEKASVMAAKSALAISKRALEAELEQLRAQTQELEDMKRTSGFETQTLQSKLKRLEGDLARAQGEIGALKEEKDDLEMKRKLLAQEQSVLEAKVRALQTESNEHNARARDSEDDLSRTHDDCGRLESLVNELQLKWKRECDEKEVLSRQWSVAREELEANMAVLRRKLDASEAKWKDQETEISQGEFQGKLKLQQAESERDALLTHRERLETQVRAAEKELAAANDALQQEKTTAESLRIRLKNALSEKDELHGALLSANLAAGRTGTALSGTSQEAMLVRLQLADVNKSELETHLAEVAAQLESANRRCATLESRCNDQAVEMEALHVQIASLRAANLKMHLSALETLPLVERLEYEHKKRTLRGDFLSQLRDFQEREDQALMRQKARLRAKYEKLVEDLLAELEQKKRTRLEHEDALLVQMQSQLREERETKRKQLTQTIREEINALERDLLAQRDQHVNVLTSAIRKEEEACSARLRESRQNSREEELIDAQRSATSRESSSAVLPSTPALRPAAVAPLSIPDWLEVDSVDEPVPVPSSSPRWNRRTSGAQNSRIREKKQHQQRKQQHKQQQQKEVNYRKWRQRVREESALLDKACLLVTKQRRELRKQAEKLKQEKQEWRQDAQTTRHAAQNPILHQMKRMIQQVR